MSDSCGSYAKRLTSPAEASQAKYTDLINVIQDEKATESSIRSTMRKYQRSLTNDSLDETAFKSALNDPRNTLKTLDLKGYKSLHRAFEKFGDSTAKGSTANGSTAKGSRAKGSRAKGSETRNRGKSSRATSRRSTRRGPSSAQSSSDA